jgi:sialate O-acetylesterase
MQRDIRLFVAAVCFASVFPAAVSRAEVKLNGIFADHMVLQREEADPVWGTADPGEQVTVAFRDQKVSTAADEHGTWRCNLENLALGDPGTLTVRGKNTVAVNDVLVGDVWLCSGQSNMGFELNAAEKAATEIAAANHPQIRMFRMKLVTSPKPETATQPSSWQVCSPETAPHFSAVAYFFARDVQEAIHVPIGIVNSSWGGTGINAWTSTEGLESDPICAAALSDWDKQMAAYPGTYAAYEAKLADWQKRADAAKAAGTLFTIRKPAPPPGPGDRNTPAGLFNGMIHPIMHFAYKGIVWYQGEQDASKYARYRSWFPVMIKQWRHDFGQGDLPFLYVQLPNDNSEGAYSTSWAFMRGVQAEALSLPNTGMAVTIDVGEDANVHPKKKQPVGQRLAWIAEAKVYGMKVPYEGPIFKSATIDGDAMVVHFERGAEGLRMKGDKLNEFTVAGADKQFRPAQAVIDGQTIRVTSPDVPHPVAVRYAWRNGSSANLYNKDGLPAGPFRSDRWQ